MPRNELQIGFSEWMNVYQAGHSYEEAIGVLEHTLTMEAIKRLPENSTEALRFLKLSQEAFLARGFLMMHDAKPTPEWTGGDSLDPKNTAFREPRVLWTFGKTGQGYLTPEPDADQQIRPAKPRFHPDESLPTDAKLAFAYRQVEDAGNEFYDVIDETTARHQQAGREKEVAVLDKFKASVAHHEAALRPPAELGITKTPTLLPDPPSLISLGESGGRSL